MTFQMYKKLCRLLFLLLFPPTVRQPDMRNSSIYCSQLTVTAQDVNLNEDKLGIYEANLCKNLKPILSGVLKIQPNNLLSF